MNKEEFYQRIDNLCRLIRQNAPTIRKFLCVYETGATAEDEIDRSIRTLEGLRDETKEYSKPPAQLNIAVFFPLNLPLYSLVLFAIAPSFFADKVLVRCPEVITEILVVLSEILSLSDIFPNIDLLKCSRTTFLYKYVKKLSSIVIFTGKYQNALTIIEQCKDKLFIFNGSGINPVVIFDDADIELASQKSYKMRIYNSGQDCAGPDVFFVHNSIREPYVAKLIHKVKQTKYGTYGVNNNIDVGPILKEGYINEVSHFIKKEREHIVFNGKIMNGIVEPYIIGKDIKRHRGAFCEFFAPIFYLLFFDDENEVTTLFKKYKKRSMYISYFSKLERFFNIDFAVKIKNQIIDDVEQGNYQYGGYGSEANFVYFDGNYYVRPILISREINNYIITQAKLNHGLLL